MFSGQNGGVTQAKKPANTGQGNLTFENYAMDQQTRQKQFEQEYRNLTQQQNPGGIESFGQYLERRESDYQQQKQDDMTRQRRAKYQKHTIDDYLAIKGQMQEEEILLAAELLERLKREHPEIRASKGDHNGNGSFALPRETKLLERKMEALALRVNAWAASGQAVMDSLSLGYLDKLEQKTNEEMLWELRQSKVPLTSEEETTLAILESYGGLTSFGASKQNQPGPYFAGTAVETVGEMLSGGLTGKIGSSLGKIAEKGADSLFKNLGGKYSKKIVTDLLEGRLSDLPMDILDALRDATGVEDFVRRLVGNQVLRLVGDSASEGLDAVRQTVRKQGNLGLIAPGQSGKMKSGSDFDLDADAPSLSVGKNNGTAVQTGKKPALKPGQYDEVITWGTQTIQARREGAGYWGTRVVQPNARVDAYERKLNPNNESYYLPKPDGGSVQFENMVDSRVQDVKLVMCESSIYHVYDKPLFSSVALLAQAQKQARVAALAGYEVEWLISDKRAAEQVQCFFRENGLDIIVTYFPE